MQLLVWPQFKVKRSFLGVFELKMVQFHVFLSLELTVLKYFLEDINTFLDYFLRLRTNKKNDTNFCNFFSSFLSFLESF